jgi:hypothetical protein
VALSQRLLALQVLQVLAGREEKYSLANYAAVAVLFATAIVMVVRAAMARLAKANLHIVPLNAQLLGQGRGSPITMQSPSQRKGNRQFWFIQKGSYLTNHVVTRIVTSR